jgi:hypothetical protein
MIPLFGRGFDLPIAPGRLSRRGNAGLRTHIGGMVDLGATSNQNNLQKKWSEWQDSNLRPLLPERKK